MFRLKYIGLGLMACFLFWAAGLQALEYSPRQILFKTSSSLQIERGRTGLTEFDAYLDEFQAVIVQPVKGMPDNRWFSANLAIEPDWNAIRNNTLQFNGIDVIQPNYLRKMHVEPNDPWYSLQQLHLVNLPQAWNYTTGSSMIIVGVVDSGLLKDHPDLQGNIYYNPNEIPDNGIDDDNNGYIDDYCGWDFSDAPEMADVALGDYLEPDNDVTDENFHGTHVAGIIGAATNNGIGIAGVCWNVKILPVRAGFRTTTGAGYLQDDDAAAGIIYAADMGSSVINMSWGDPNYSAIIADACSYAHDRGIVLIASAGNDPGPNLSYPAKLSSVISVGAVDQYKNLAGFSSYGAELDLVAPGQQIYSTYKSEGPEVYKEMSGTSMSSPFVAGAAALLKSVQPHLTPDEIRSRLLTSCDDLGDPGFDIRFGHGLLNTQKLMENLNSPFVQVDFPADNMGVSGDFDIIGTVSGENFWRYSVMCALQNGTADAIWKDVYTNNQSPQFFFEPVTNGVLANFRIHDEMEEGHYLIRVQFWGRDGSKYNMFRAVNLDLTAPYIVANTFQVFKRYDGQNVRYYAGAKFNEVVRSELIVHISGMEPISVFPAKVDSIQVWALPNSIPPGYINVEIHATNNSNLDYNSPLMTNVVNIQYETVPNYGFESRVIGNPMIPLNRFYDFDGNGIPEFLGMELPTSGYGIDSFYEPTDSVLTIKHSYTKKFMPLDMGDTNGSGQEILTLELDTAVLYETLSEQTYPSTAIWTETAVSGGIIADYDNDGVKDFIIVKNLPNARVIQMHKRIGIAEVSMPKITLYNTTPTFERNMFVPTVICANLDGDAYPDILTADTDGDVMVFEVRSATTVDSLVWLHRMPVANTYYLTAGDYDGNGTTDFMVGGYSTDLLDPNQNYWFFEAFTRSGNSQYTSMGSIQFNNVFSQNAIQSYDLDGDGRHELILSLTPNLYILKYINGVFQPIYYGNSSRTFQIAAWHHNGQPHFLTNGIDSADSLKAFVWTKQTPFTGPAIPANFLVQPLNESQVSLSWLSNNADHYCIYRKDASNQMQMLAEITATGYIDTTVQAGMTYHYAISAVNHNYTPHESNLSQWIEAIPMSVPQVTDISIIGSHELRIAFDQGLASSALNPGCYYIDHDMGHPLSVNSVLNQHGVQLRFRNAFPETDIDFQLRMQGVYGVTGVAVSQLNHYFAYNEDFTPPVIESVEVLADKRSIRIMMSELIDESSAAPLANYELMPPANDAANSIQSVSPNDNSITILLRHKIKYSNRPYYLVLNHIKDLAGNTIAYHQNVCTFALTDITNLEKVVVYPNPIKTAEHDAVSFLNFPTDKTGNLAIYNLSGDLVYQSKIGPFNPNNNNLTCRWNLKNQNGKKVSSGIYYYVVNMAGDTKRGKIAVLN